ncbi:hypothetical protein L249_1136 [Ophiocordyceps polyrhachis-furcata BCC 54312]|uniref:GTP cyclohydrolase II n=1 Tax=Ophiocordyceps polyrhachis-furcata BCC 54312 TaxID=1330021 RepID=A0A367LFD0_9HYPO|nr:hypothetical protein L249_1136 [Ophiocordyceps polyrhachis-furcata BCC 54312]
MSLQTSAICTGDRPSKYTFKAGAISHLSKPFTVTAARSSLPARENFHPFAGETPASSGPEHQPLFDIRGRLSDRPHAIRLTKPILPPIMSPDVDAPCRLPSFYSPPTKPEAATGQPIDLLSLPESSTVPRPSPQPSPPPSLLSPAVTPRAQTPSASAPRGVPVDSSIPSGGCGTKRPRLLETLPEVQCIVRARIPTVAGTEMFLHLYTNSVDSKEHLAIVFGNHIRSQSLDAPREGETEMDRMVRGAYTGRLYPGRTASHASAATADESVVTPSKTPPLVRIHSECYTGETAWSARCDCGEQLDEAARLMGLPESASGGIIIYLRQEGRGIGLSEKLKAYNLQDLGSDTVEANLLLRHPADARSYGLATAMLLDLGQTDIRLLTNNPDKVRAVEGPNREIVVRERVPMVPLSWKGQGGFRSDEVEGYLKTKVGKAKSRFEIVNMPLQEPLRLRLSVHRYGVPDVKLVWPCERSSDFTIFKLLDQVNQVIPLETSEWGLEDYAVELADSSGGSYECLHFQQVSEILKNDDEVIIRCLQGDDLKRRRLTGRHQISADGRHLVDGIVFGRPWLRTPRDRPALELPPRKRARFAEDYYDGNDDIDKYAYGHDERQPRLLEEDPDAFDDDESFHDSGPDQDGDESSGDDMDDEGDDEKDLAADRKFLLQANQTLDHVVLRGATSNTVMNGLDLNSLDGIVALRAAFPLTPVTAIEAELLRNNKDVEKAYNSLNRSNDSALSFDKVKERCVMRGIPIADGSASKSNTGSASSVQSAERPLIEVVESVEDESSGSAVDEKESSDSDTDDEVTSLPQDTSSDSSESDTDDQTAGAAQESSSDDGEAGSDCDGRESLSDSSGTSDSDSSLSDSSDDGAPVGQLFMAHSQQAKTGSGSQGGHSSTVKGDKPAPTTENQAGHKSRPLTKTQKRNARRRMQTANRQAERERSVHVLLENHKQQLLRSIAPPRSAEEDAASEALLEVDAGEIAPDKRRSRVDNGAGRRLLFGALGLKAPKTKAEEDEIKQILMKGVRPLQNPRLEQSEAADESTPTAPDPADDSWRQKLTYCAEECCHEDVHLSSPPFPFKQRWDPQQRWVPQQGTEKAGSKRKRKHAEDFYGDCDSGLCVDEEDANRTRSEATGGDSFPDTADEDLVALPADLNILPVLRAEAVREGMIITWRQMVMSKATRWQPQIAQRTGRVLSGTDEAEVHVQLAVRDREDRKKTYDAKTGQRVYDKFEAPDLDGEDDVDGDDDGVRMLSWEELIDPRILGDGEEAETMVAATVA